MNKLRLFEAYFQYSFDGCADEIFTEHLDIFLPKVSDEKGLVKTKTFLQTYLTGSDLPIFKKSLPIPFDLYSLHSISPETFRNDGFKTILSFKVNSYNVKVIQIDNNCITFEKFNKEILTVVLFPNIQLFKISNS